jgi:hypothetical protein
LVFGLPLGLTWGLIGGLAVGLAVVLTVWIDAPADAARVTSPLDVLKLDRSASLAFGLAAGLSGALMFGFAGGLRLDYPSRAGSPADLWSGLRALGGPFDQPTMVSSDRSSALVVDGVSHRRASPWFAAASRRSVPVPPRSTSRPTRGPRQ